MIGDYSILLWLLKLGSLTNLYFLLNTRSLVSDGADAYIVVPAQIFFAVSAYRCLFPVRYEHNVVFHDSFFSSIFATRLFATFSEIAYIFQFSHVLRLLNSNQVVWIDVLSWVMVVQVVVSQIFVWAAVLTGQLRLYYYEELGWAVIFVANTIASAYLFLTADVSASLKILLELNLLFGAVYLPWQVMHLRALRATASGSGGMTGPSGSPISMQLANGLKRALRVKNRRTDAASWGGFIGLTWMTAYWAILIPTWVYYIARVLPGH